MTNANDNPRGLPVVESMSETLARRIRASLGQFDDADRDVQTLVRQLATDYAALLAEVEALRADAARMDYIERTFSGMTNRERYLPVQMIWGKGCNGRTLREACDKYMARDAAMAGANTEAKPSREAGLG